jgi:hypothetical protein
LALLMMWSARARSLRLVANLYTDFSMKGAGILLAGAVTLFAPMTVIHCPGVISVGAVPCMSGGIPSRHTTLKAIPILILTLFVATDVAADPAPVTSRYTLLALASTVKPPTQGCFHATLVAPASLRFQLRAVPPVN